MGNSAYNPSNILALEGAGLFLGGPASGSATSPAFRSLAASDLPAATNHTADSSDYSMSPGELIYKTYSSVTSVVLHVATATPGLYELQIAGNMAVATNSSTVTLGPNNTTYSTAFYRRGFNTGTSTDGSNALIAVGTDNSFIIGIGTLVRSICYISTTTASKSIIAYIQSNTQTSGNPIMVSYVLPTAWNDTSTVWTSLGTITFPFSQSGTILIKRVM